MKPLLEDWRPLPEIMAFLNYKPTRIASLLKDPTIKVSKIGKRKFIYIPSLEAFLEKNSKR